MGIKSVQSNQSKSIKSPSKEIESMRAFINNHPVFCFQFLQRGFTLEECSDDEKASLITRLCKIATLKWTDLQTTGRDGLGSEKISYNSIRVGKPDFVTKDASFLSFKFSDISRIIGYRRDFIFHVIYIDPKGRAYKH